MKVAYINADFDVPLYGDEGCSIHVREVTNALADAGHDVITLCSNIGTQRGTTMRSRVFHIEPQGVELVAWNALSAEGAIEDHFLERDLRSILFNSWMQTEGGETILREQPDFLYERYSLFGWAGVSLSRQSGVPLILEVNAPLCDEQEGYERFPLAATARAAEGEVLRAADAVIVVSRWLAEWTIAQGVPASKVHIIPNGVPAYLVDEPVTDVMRQRLGFTGKRVIGFVGSFQPWHGVESLLNAFAVVHASDTDARLLLVGDGDRRKAVQQRVMAIGLENAVVFAGPVPHEEVAAYLHAMDVAVAPALRLPLGEYRSPMKLFEYMAAGRATVVANVGQTAEVIEHGRNGLLYDPSDESALTAALQALLQSPATAQSMGAAARETVRGHHTWDAIAERIVAIARELRHSPVAECSDAG